MERAEDATPGEGYRAWRVRMPTVVAAVAGFLFGSDSSVINGGVSAISDQFALSEDASGLAVAFALLGCAVGAYAAGRLADRWGPNVDHVLGGGAVPGGVGMGRASVIAPAYRCDRLPRGLLREIKGLSLERDFFRPDRSRGGA
ncbi:MFS transporter [Streptomyces sp. NBC_01604]|uniref:MFS transporter n=1 Tax=Streptomyces sp. NBC_01604 TaxID=2975894 RepID=UPI003863AFB3